MLSQHRLSCVIIHKNPSLKFHQRPHLPTRCSFCTLFYLSLCPQFSFLPNDSVMSDQIRGRKSRAPPHPASTHSQDRDPNSIPYKSTISSILLSSKKKNFASATFRGLGCTSSSQVSVPSADWEPKKLKKKRFKTNDNIPVNNAFASSSEPRCVSVPDVWRAPAMGLITDAARSPSRDKLDGSDRILLSHRERSHISRRMVSLESETGFGMHSDVSASRYHRHGIREGLAELVMLQNSLLLGGRFDGLDRYRDMRLDIDNMSYEELLELGDRIGYVNTGLGDGDISRCLRKTKLDLLDDFSSHFASEMDRQCSICQEEYEAENEMGRLDCGHMYHLDCIKHWLRQKNCCPICKTAAMSQN